MGKECLKLFASVHSSVDCSGLSAHLAVWYSYIYIYNKYFYDNKKIYTSIRSHSHLLMFLEDKSLSFSKSFPVLSSFEASTWE